VQSTWLSGALSVKVRSSSTPYSLSPFPPLFPSPRSLHSPIFYLPPSPTLPPPHSSFPPPTFSHLLLILPFCLYNVLHISQYTHRQVLGDYIWCDEKALAASQRRVGLIPIQPGSRPFIVFLGKVWENCAKYLTTTPRHAPELGSVWSALHHHLLGLGWVFSLMHRHHRPLRSRGRKKMRTRSLATVKCCCFVFLVGLFHT